MDVGVMICYARSGGTLLNKCIGVMPNTLVLSEVSPVLDNISGAREITPHLFPSWMARNWFGVDIDDSNFSQEMRELIRHCYSNGKTLVVRDWSFLSFSKLDNYVNVPSRQLEILRALSDVDLRPFAFVRNAIDVWISRGKPNPDVFAEDYLAYAQAVVKSGMPIVHYEDFCTDPHPVMKKICNIIGIEYDETFISKYNNYTYVFGDEQVVGGSRGKNAKNIVALSRKKLSQQDNALIHSNAAIHEANELFGYVSGEEARFETIAETLTHDVRKIKNLISNQSLVNNLKAVRHFVPDVSDRNRLGKWLGDPSSWPLFKEGVWVVIGQILLVLGALLGVRLMTELLDPADYGELALGMTMTTLANQVIFGPLGNGIARFYAAAQEQGDFGGYLSATRQLASSATKIIACMFLLTVTGLLIVERTEWIVITTAALIFALLSGYNSILNSIQNAARQRSIVALHQGMEPWARFLVAAGLILWIGATSKVAMLGYAMSALLVLGSQFVFFRKIVPSNIHVADKEASWREQIWKYSLPFATWGIFVWGQQASDRWALGLFATTQEVGLYAVLFQLGYYPISLATSMAMQYLAPILYQRAGDASDSRRIANVHSLSWRLTWFSLGVTGAAFVVAFLLHNQIFRFFVAEEYAPVSYLLPWMILSGGIFAAGQTMALNLMSQMKTHTMIVAKIATALLGITLNFAGAYWFGILGIVIAGVIFSVAHLFWMVVLSKKSCHTHMVGERI